MLNGPGEVPELVERVFARQDVLAACARRDLGAVIRILNAHGVTQGQIDFPGYPPEQLAAIFCRLADEAGLRLTAGARRKAATILAQAEAEQRSGNARLAVGLLNEARAAQARRVAAASSAGRDLAALVTITETDIPQHLQPGGNAPEEDGPACICDLRRWPQPTATAPRSRLGRLPVPRREKASFLRQPRNAEVCTYRSIGRLCLSVNR